MPLTRDELLRMYRRMLEIRIFEQSLVKFFEVRFSARKAGD